MKIRATVRPGRKGTQRLLAEYGDRLVCVRYRYDVRRRKRYKTIELIIDEKDWKLKPKRTALMLVKVQWGEVAVARQVKAAGGKWNGKQKAWELSYGQVVALGLEGRVVGRGDGRRGPTG